jgi:hypothetical protein
VSNRDFRHYPRPGRDANVWNTGNKILGESYPECNNEESDFGSVSVSRIIPHLCGLPTHRRRARKLIMAKVFVDDSGSSKEEPIMYVAAWVGKVETWDRFANEWDKALTASNPKPIDYFKHYEARSLRKCFAGFTESQANEKMLNLAEVISRHSIYGVGFMLPREYHRRMIQKHALIIRGHASKILTDPFFICMNALMCYVLGAEHRNSPNDKVDFIFDGKPGSRQANLTIMMYENNRDSFMPEPYRSIMGTAMPMNDMDVLPLQAADFLAGQVRAALPVAADGHSLIPVEADPEPLALMRKHRSINIFAVPESDILDNISMNNVGISTRRLSTIKRERGREKKA